MITIIGTFWINLATYLMLCRKVYLKIIFQFEAISFDDNELIHLIPYIYKPIGYKIRTWVTSAPQRVCVLLLHPFRLCPFVRGGTGRMFYSGQILRRTASMESVMTKPATAQHKVWIIFVQELSRWGT